MIVSPETDIFECWGASYTQNSCLISVCSANDHAIVIVDWRLTSSLSDHTGIELKFWKVKMSDRQDEVRSTLLEIRQLGINKFLLLTSVTKTRVVMSMARRLGIVAVPYNWLILHLVSIMLLWHLSLCDLTVIKCTRQKQKH